MATPMPSFKSLASFSNSNWKTRKRYKGNNAQNKKLCVHRGGAKKERRVETLMTLHDRVGPCVQCHMVTYSRRGKKRNEKTKKQKKMLGRYETVPCHFILYSVYCVSRRIVTRKETKGRWRAPALDITCLKGSTYILEADTKYRRDGLCCITSIVMYLWCYYILSHLIK